MVNKYETDADKVYLEHGRHFAKNFIEGMDEFYAQAGVDLMQPIDKESVQKLIDDVELTKCH